MEKIGTLDRQEFAALRALASGDVSSQRELATVCGVSLGAANRALNSLKHQGLAEGFEPTAAGMEALAPYRVRNAVIMAAGMSTRFAPISYERPKGVLRVRGEVLIERQIRQLREVGITDITVVVGYMKEQFFYLEDLLGVKIRTSEVYASRNNHSTLMVVREQLGNTYVCSSDDYFTENPFDLYVYRSYYAAEYHEGPTEEYCLKVGSLKRIVGVTVGGADSYVMMGHAYFDRAFAREFVRILEAEYDLPETAPKLWEDLFRAHLDTLTMVMKPYECGVINEFDSLEELSSFDGAFINNVDCSILDNICSILGCERDSIGDIYPIKQGLTNLSFHFSCDGAEYVYRHPGAGTDEIITRASESFSQKIAFDLGLDDTFVHEDPVEGWKISRFIPNCTELDYHDFDQVKQALSMARTLHRCGVSSQWTFNLYENTKELIALLDECHRVAFRDFTELYELIEELNEAVSSDGTEPCLCHNDFYSPNFLVEQSGRMYLIDWEYSGMSDYASDLGTFVCCSDYGYDEVLEVLRAYFERDLEPAELFHCIAYIAIASYYWFIWALYKDACDNPVGEWLYLWYRNAKTFGARARKLRA